MGKTLKLRRFKPVMREFYDWGESILVALASVVLILTFAIRGTVVDGRSMVPTLQDSQFLTMTRLYTKLNYNDIVVVYASGIYNENEQAYGKPIIKRVIGLPGDEISIDTESGKVFRNGQELAVEVIDGIIYEDGHTINDYTRTLRHFPDGETVTVPEKHVFVMGDNRNDSIDSRDKSVGMVDDNLIIGKVFLRITPFELFGTIK